MAQGGGDGARGARRGARGVCGVCTDRGGDVDPGQPSPALDLDQRCNGGTEGGGRGGRAGTGIRCGPEVKTVWVCLCVCV